jgi:hypothetical protein
VLQELQGLPLDITLHKTTSGIAAMRFRCPKTPASISPR